MGKKNYWKIPQKENKGFIEARWSFMDDGASSFTMQPTQNNNCEVVPTMTQDVDPDILNYFLLTYMKSLRNQKYVEGLQELINSCASKEVPQSEMSALSNPHWHKKKNGKEMRLTAHIREYDMDQVILDLGSNANVLPKHTLELIGKPKLPWSLI